MENKGFFVTGTDTEVGKTLITAQIGNIIQKENISLGIMKPIETGLSSSLALNIFSDAELLKTTLEVPDPIEDISPYRYQNPVAPLLAAKLENKPIQPKKIIASYRKLRRKYNVVLSEGAGGVLVPITGNYLMADLAKDMDMPLIIVTRFDLGTINQTALTIEAAHNRGLQIEGIIFNCLKKNQPTEFEKYTPQILEEIYKIPVIAICPFMGKNPKANLVEKGWKNKNETAFSYFRDWARKIS